LTVKLQKKARDISSAYREIGEVTSCIQGLRESVHITFTQWFGECKNMAQACGLDITIPRQCQRQTLRDNHPAEDAEEFFRRSLAIPFLDYLSSDLQSRFSHPKLAADGLTLVPANVVEHAAQGFNKVPDGIQGLASLWEADLPSICELEAEYNRWVCKWQHKEIVPSTAVEALKLCDRDIFPNIHQLLRLLCTLPITTAECERSISRLRTLKTYLRSTMGQNRLNGLALLRVHRDVPVSVSAAVDSFALKYRTMMKLLPQNLLIQ
jgi:hypothetical protein